MAHIPSWVVGVALAVAVAYAAHRAKSLSPSGAVAAATIGTIAIAAGWSWGIVLIVYFVSSSLLSRFRAAQKAERMGDRVEKGGARDAVQVLANGGVFAAAAAGNVAAPDALWQWVGAGALAASASDTWATELGSLSRVSPRSIIGLKRVPAGTSGAVTGAGFIAAAAAALLMAGAVRVVGWNVNAAGAALVGGLAGCLMDSVIGATLQARRWCDGCGAATERTVHSCGRPTRVIGGLARLDNDGVNLVATVTGALLGAGAASYL